MHQSMTPNSGKKFFQESHLVMIVHAYAITSKAHFDIGFKGKLVAIKNVK